MPSFFLITGTIFASCHAYLFFRMRVAFGGGWWQLPVILGFCLMTAAYMTRRMPPDFISPALFYWVTMTWAGLLLITTTCVLTLDLSRVLVLMWDFATDQNLRAFLRLPRTLPIVLCISLLLAGYAFYTAYAVPAAYLSIQTPKLAPGAKPIRIALMTDVHLSHIVGPERLDRMLEVVRREKPDLLLLGGDIVDRDMLRSEAETALFRDAMPQGTVYAILGNHEVYAGLDNSLSFYKNAGIPLLRNEAVSTHGITIVGVDDPMVAGGSQDALYAREKALLREQDQTRFTLLLRHRPGTPERAAGLFDLQLSGHTHGGQIWPGQLFVRFSGQPGHGLHTVTGEDGTSSFYVSNGTGFWGPPMRLFATPEVTIITLSPSGT